MKFNKEKKNSSILLILLFTTALIKSQHPHVHPHISPTRTRTTYHPTRTAPRTYSHPHINTVTHPTPATSKNILYSHFWWIPQIQPKKLTSPVKIKIDTSNLHKPKEIIEMVKKILEENNKLSYENFRKNKKMIFSSHKFIGNYVSHPYKNPGNRIQWVRTITPKPVIIRNTAPVTTRYVNGYTPAYFNSKNSPSSKN